MTQIITNSNGGGGSSSSGDMKKAVYDPQNIENDAFDYENFTNTPDLSVYQTKGNLVTDLTNPDNTHYPSAKAVSDAISGAGAGDMLKSVYDPDNVEANAFDYNNFINTPDIPTDTSELTNGAGFITGIDSSDVTTALGYTPYDATNPDGYVTDSIINDTAYGAGWDGDTTHAPTKNAVYDKIDSIDELIPSAATSSNQLADKNYVNDSINSVTAYYITKDAAGNQFATKAELTAATTFYSGGVVRVPTRNDYTIVLADEDHDNATTRYIYNSGWEYQYTVNETALTQAQLDALNSGITSGKVSTYDGYATTISGKQDALSTQTAYTTKGTATKVPTISTNTLGQVTGITETSIAFPVTSVNGSTGAVTVSEFNPGGTATTGYVLKKTADGYGWDAESGAVTSVNGQTGAVTVSEFTPSSSGSANQVLTKTAGGYDWAAPSGGIGISTDANNILTSGASIWVGTEANYQAIATKSDNTIYLTI